MPRLQSHSGQLHSSPVKPISPRPKLPQTTKPHRPTKLLSTVIKKTTPTTPFRSSTPTPHQRLKPTKSKKKKYTPSPSRDHDDAFSLISFYDHLSHELDSKPSSTRKPKKHSSNFHALILPHPSDNEEVHSIYLPFTNHSSRSSTPTPTKTPRFTLFDHPDEPFTMPDDDLFPPSPSAERTSTAPKTFATASTPSLPPPRRRHVRAKSVASIFELGKSTSTVGGQPKGAKDDWDMPTVAPSQDLTWQQKEKKSPLPAHSSPVNHLTQSPAQHDPLRSSTRSTVNNPSKEGLPTRQQKSSLARTSSAGTIKRFLPPSDKLTKPKPPYSSRSDDESALTWQQSIIRPLPKFKPLPVSSDPSLIPPETKSGPCKKNLGTSSGHKTPVRPLSTTRKIGVHSALKPKPSTLLLLSKRRSSLSSGHTLHSQNQPDNTHAQAEPIGLSIGPKSGRDDISWHSFPSSAVVNHHPGLPPLHSHPLPIDGAQVDFTPPRRHTKSYTLQPATLSSRRATQSSPNQTLNSAPAYPNIPESNHHKMMVTPSKSRSTSEDLNLASPDKQLTTPALRAAFMYAGPQFHNSPCPAALPAPKFSFGSV